MLMDFNVQLVEFYRILHGLQTRRWSFLPVRESLHLAVTRG